MAVRILPLPAFVLISLVGLSFTVAQDSQELPANSGPPPASPFAPPSDPADQPAPPADATGSPAVPPNTKSRTDPVPPNQPAVGSASEPPPQQQPRQPGVQAPPRSVRRSVHDSSGVTLRAVVHKPVGIYYARELVLGGNAPAAKAVLGTLSKRYPADARVAYLRYILRYYTGRPKAALSSLEHAIALEYYRPVGDYHRFMEPIQGAARVYAERVRQSVSRLDSMGKLEVRPFEEILARPDEGAPNGEKEQAEAKRETSQGNAVRNP